MARTADSMRSRAAMLHRGLAVHQPGLREGVASPDGRPARLREAGQRTHAGPLSGPPARRRGGVAASITVKEHPSGRQPPRIISFAPISGTPGVPAPSRLVTRLDCEPGPSCPRPSWGRQRMPPLQVIDGGHLPLDSRKHQERLGPGRARQPGMDTQGASRLVRGCGRILATKCPVRRVSPVKG